MRGLLVLAALLSSAPALSTSRAADPPSPAIPSFVEETGSGISSVYAGEWEFMVGGGVATFDCNADGFPDLVTAGGTNTAKFYRNTSQGGGALTFAVEKSGLELDKVTGAYPIDIDADGIVDVVLLRVGENIVMRGRGNCRFERVSEAWGFDGGDAWTAAFAATWEQGANWPTLAFGNYIDRTKDTEPWGSCTDNWLHRPAGAERKFAPPIPLKPSYCALGMLFTDWNHSGTPSLRVANDREYYEGGQEQMWRVEPGKPPALYTEQEGWARLKIWGMGIASTYLDAKGYPAYALTSMSDNKLQVLADAATPPKPVYKDIAYASGAGAWMPYTGPDKKPSTAWHVEFQDVNNDGLDDLFYAKGNIAKMPDFAMRDPNNLLLRTAEGKFVEAGDKAGVASFALSRGGALTDFNLDGLIDIVVVNRWESAQIWRNTSTNAGRFIEIQLKQDGPNRNAIGAFVEVKAGGHVMRREITIGGGHASGELGWRHFGLGTASEAEIRVIWPGGHDGGWKKVAAGGFYFLERGQEPRAWRP